MGYLVDPEGNETKVLLALCDFTQKEVVEVGCGDGRMTWRYADRTRSVLGIDPNAGSIERAIASTPNDLTSLVRFRVADITNASLPQEAFDVAILSWSL